MSQTVITDTNAKLDIMEHVNQDHTEEVMAIITHHYPEMAITHAFIKDIYNEGMLVTAQKHTDKQDLFVAFELKGDIEEQILYLAYMAMAKQGKDLTGNKKQYFEVIGKVLLTENMMRLTLKSQTPLPDNYAGYAYGMVLKVMNKIPPKPTSTGRKSHWLMRQFNQALLWWAKKLSREKRQKLLETMSKDIRLYTLRSAWSSREDVSYFDLGYMDIYTHDQSRGSLWSASLKVGDIVLSRTETADKHSHLDKGQSILIADETAYPAVAGILECWQNPTPPYVITISSQQQEQHYFDGFAFPKGTQHQTLVLPHTEHGSAVIERLKDIEVIDGVWAGLENNAAKSIRHYLRGERHLSGKQNHVKGYWRAGK